MKESQVYGLIAKIRSELKFTNWNIIVLIILVAVNILFTFLAYKAITCY